MVSRPYRLVAPFVVAGLIAAGAVAPTLRAAATPDLPAITPEHLIAKVLDEKVSHLSATLQWKAQLGLPSLSGLTSGAGQGVSTSSSFDPTALLSGSHTFRIWIDGAERQRIAAPGSLSETDVVHRGDQAWLYDSSTDHVTHYILRPGSKAGSMPAQPLDGVNVTTVADTLLGDFRSGGTIISVGRPVKVAGRAAYVLRLAPDRSLRANRASTVSAVTIAVDAKTGLPLRVSLYAVGESDPALQVGYASINYATPGASNFAAPTGQTTTTKVVGPVAPPGKGQPTGPGHGPGTHGSASIGTDWGTIRSLPAGAMTRRDGELNSVTTVVSGSWGSGRLLQSTLVNALFVDHGPVLVGAVTPAALETAAGHLPH
jgi:outer membrane lipoprotein-sorting protein